MRSRVSGPRVPVTAVLLAAVLAILATAASAAEPPPDLAALQSLEPKAGPEVPFAEEKRADAVRLAALGFGSRAGLARRTWEIAALLERHAGRLSAIYRFGDLMLSEAGFSVLPPVVAETRDAFRLERAGTRAASAERVLRIVAPARLLSAAPHWRDWLGRSWPDAAPPASVLFPRDAGERTRWRTLLGEGFAQGAALADDIFSADLDRLNLSFEGVILWHRLHRAAMVTAPGIETARTGVSGHERLMRVRAASARLARPARFELDAALWAPPAGRSAR